MTTDNVNLSAHRSKFVLSSVDHPRLTKTDATSIRVFLRAYDQYATEVKERAKQLAAKDVVSTEVARPVNLKFCVDAEWIESLIALDFLDDVTTYEELSDTRLRAYLDDKAVESKEVVTLDVLDDLVAKELRINMADSNAQSRIENLFISYHTLLRRHGLSWLLTDNQKLAVHHVLSAIRPEILRSRLESDLDFSHHHLRKDFKAFMKHAIKLSDAFQLVDIGVPKNSSNKSKKARKTRGGNKDGNNDLSADSSGSPGKQDSNLPICLYPPHQSKGYRHLLRDCKACPDHEKKALLKARAEEKEKTGPSRSTRSQTAAAIASSSTHVKSEDKKVAGRLKPPARSFCSSSFAVKISDGTESVTASGRADDGSDESIVSPKVAENAVLNGIGKFKKIPPISLQVALKDGDDPQKFTFSRTWTPPRTVLLLSAGPLALVNVTFLVADADLSVEDLLIGLPVLQHLGVDTKTLLEERRDLLDGSDCSSIGAANTGTPGGQVSRLMIARLNRVPNSHVSTDNPSVDTRPRVNYFKVKEEEDPFPDSSLMDPVDSTQSEEVKVEIDNMLQLAVTNGFPTEKLPQLQELVLDHADLFRTSFSSGPPADIPPLKVDLVPDARPVRVRLRNYSQEQREFLSNMVNKLVENGLAYPNPTSPWASAPLLVPKPGPAKFRFTVDLRPINRFTVKHQFPMPNIEQELTKVAGSVHFGTFDLSHCYWQLPLHRSSQSSQSFITPDGIYSPTRVLHGTTNAVMFLQSTISSNIPADLRPHILFWLDDILLHSRTIDDHLDAIRLLFSFCKKFNFKLHPAKCNIFSTCIRWCGRLLSSKGIRFDPRRIDGLRNMQLPTTGAHLQQFVCAMQWMRSAIPAFSVVIRPLSEFLEKVYNATGKRTRQAAARILLSTLDWGKTEQDAFDRCKAAVEQQVTLAHRDISRRLCVYTDASDLIWSGIVTQVPPEDLSLPHVDQRHQPLSFLSGHFTGPQLGWSTLEKEAFAIMATVERMHWLLATTDGFDLYTDHHNLIFLFDPLAVVPDLSQTSLRKVLRWAVRLSAYNYTCVHIKGVDNVWADLLGRWSAPVVIRRLVKIPPLPSSSSEDFEWPSPSEFKSAQESNSANRPSNFVLKDSLWTNSSNAVWIPDACTDLQLRLCIIAHTGPSGHRGTTSTIATLQENFFWSTLSSDVRTFVRSCIHCLSTTGGERVPRPFGPAVHGTSPNDLLQFDYIEVAPSASAEKYVLMLRDDHSDYKWFFAFPDTSAENAARAIIDWAAAFGAPKCLMSDGPTHFKNETVRLVSKGLKVPHHFTLPYSPWSNGAVERLGKELMRTFRSITSELQLRPDEWPDLLPLVQSVLNNAPSPQRGNISPVTAFTGMDASPPIATFYRSITSTTISISDLQSERAFNVEALRSKIAQLHPVVQDALKSNRERIRDSRSRGSLPNFTEGDFVLVARDDFTAGEKLSLRWRGPRRVIRSINDHVYQVEDLRNGQVEDVHCTRLKFYHDPSLDTEAIMSHVISSETGMPVQRLMRLVDSDDGIMVQVRWRGLPESEDTLEPVQKVFEDVPQLLEKLFRRKNTPASLVSKARHALAL